MKIANFFMSSSVRPSFKINLLKSAEIKLSKAVVNNNPSAVNIPIPIGVPSNSP